MYIEARTATVLHIFAVDAGRRSLISKVQSSRVLEVM
jgi:hypothetical protein